MKGLGTVAQLALVVTLGCAASEDGDGGASTVGEASSVGEDQSTAAATTGVGTTIAATTSGTTGAADESTGPPPSCDETGEPGGFTATVEPIFVAHCSCHTTATSAGLSLACGQGHGNLVGVASTQVPTIMRVVAGDPMTSYLWLKLNNAQGSVGGTGVRMPKLGDPLTADELAAISDWIAAGAPP